MLHRCLLRYPTCPKCYENSPWNIFPLSYRRPPYAHPVSRAPLCVTSRSSTFSLLILGVILPLALATGSQTSLPEVLSQQASLLFYTRHSGDPHTIGGAVGCGQPAHTVEPRCPTGAQVSPKFDGGMRHSSNCPGCGGEANHRQTAHGGCLDPVCGEGGDC